MVWTPRTAKIILRKNKFKKNIKKNPLKIITKPLIYTAPLSIYTLNKMADGKLSGRMLSILRGRSMHYHNYEIQEQIDKLIKEQNTPPYTIKCYSGLPDP